MKRRIIFGKKFLSMSLVVLGMLPLVPMSEFTTFAASNYGACENFVTLNPDDNDNIDDSNDNGDNHDQLVDSWVRGDDGEWYYYDENGTMWKNKWIQSNGEWYYLGSDGTMSKNEWVQSNGEWYYLGSDGTMSKNELIQSNGKWYYLGSDGTMSKNEWISVSGKWYYIDANGEVVDPQTQQHSHNYDNGFCSYCGAMDGIAKVGGYTISLGGNIAVNFHMRLSDEVVNDNNAKMVFTVPDSGSSYTVEIPVTQGEKNGDYYIFTCEVAAKEMTSVIKAQIFTSVKSSEIFEYSVQEYANIILENAANNGKNPGVDYSSYVKAAPLVKAMLNYGAYAQTYFDYNVSNLANSFLDEQDKLLDEVDFSEYESSISGTMDGIDFYGGVLSLKSETAIKLYYEFQNEEDAKLTVIVNGKETDIEKNGRYYEIKISDIPAHELSNMHEIKIDELTLKYSVFSYANAAMNSDNEELKNVVKAMYVYNQKAIEYKN